MEVMVYMDALVNNIEIPMFEWEIIRFGSRNKH